MPYTSELARSFHALSDPIRINIVELLEYNGHTVRELTQYLGLTQSHLNWHLKTLSETGIVVEKRHGRERFYTLDPKALKDAVKFLYRLGTVGRGRPIG
jgi:ArsR family transcriptional regulator